MRSLFPSARAGGPPAARPENLAGGPPKRKGAPSHRRRRRAHPRPSRAHAHAAAPPRTAVISTLATRRFFRLRRARRRPVDPKAHARRLAAARAARRAARRAAHRAARAWHRRLRLPALRFRDGTRRVGDDISADLASRPARHHRRAQEPVGRVRSGLLESRPRSPPRPGAAPRDRPPRRPASQACRVAACAAQACHCCRRGAQPRPSHARPRRGVPARAQLGPEER